MKNHLTDIPEWVFMKLCQDLDSSELWEDLPGAMFRCSLKVTKPERELAPGPAFVRLKDHLSCLSSVKHGNLPHINVYGACLLGTFEAKSAILPCSMPPLSTPRSQISFTYQGLY